VKLGIDGVNTRPLMRAADPLIGIAGNWGSPLRPHLEPVLCPLPSVSRQRVGHQSALHALKYACYFLDCRHLACSNRRAGRMRCCPGFGEVCAPATQRPPLSLDSAAYCESRNSAA
jgi:hypothetical protein